MNGLREAIERRIRREDPGWAFTRKDLRDLAPTGQLGVILSRLVRAGLIRRIGRGLFEYPRQSRLLKEALPPDIDATAQAIARKHRWTIAPDGAMAANVLGLSPHVPARIHYLSDGPTRTLEIGRQTITFRHASPKHLRLEHYSSRLIANALRFLGRKGVDDAVIRHLQRTLPRVAKARFLRDAKYGTDWIFGMARRLAERGSRG